MKWRKDMKVGKCVMFGAKGIVQWEFTAGMKQKFSDRLLLAASNRKRGLNTYGLVFSHITRSKEIGNCWHCFRCSNAQGYRIFLAFHSILLHFLAFSSSAKALWFLIWLCQCQFLIWLRQCQFHIHIGRKGERKPGTHLFFYQEILSLLVAKAGLRKWLLGKGNGIMIIVLGCS